MGRPHVSQKPEALCQEKSLRFWDSENGERAHGRDMTISSLEDAQSY